MSRDVTLPEVEPTFEASSALALTHLTEGIGGATVANMNRVMKEYVYNKYDKHRDAQRGSKQQQTPPNQMTHNNYQMFRPVVRLRLRVPSSTSTTANQPTSADSNPFVTVRATLDTGASISIISASLFSQLSSQSMSTTWFWPKGVDTYPGNSSGFIYRWVEVEVAPLANEGQPNDNSTQSSLIRLYVYDSMLASSLQCTPSQALSDTVRRVFGIGLSDAPDTKSTSVDLVIGQDLLQSVFLGHNRPVHFLTPHLAVINTRFGYCLQGIYKESQPHMCNRCKVLLQSEMVPSTLDQQFPDLVTSRPMPQWLMEQANKHSQKKITPIRKKLRGPFKLPYKKSTKDTLLTQCSSAESEIKRQLEQINAQRKAGQPIAAQSECDLFAACQRYRTLVLTLDLCIDPTTTTVRRRWAQLDGASFFLLPTMAVSVEMYNGANTIASSSSVNLLLDSGSPISLISSGLATRLALELRSLAEPIVIRKGPPRVEITHWVMVRLRSLVAPEEVFADVKLLVHPDKTLGRELLPGPTLTKLVHNKLDIELRHQTDNDLQQFCQGDILLGTDVITEHFQLAKDHSIELLPNLRLVANRFGWTVQGSSGFVYGNGILGLNFWFNPLDQKATESTN